MPVATAKALDKSNGFDKIVSPLYDNCPFPFFTGNIDVLGWNLERSCCPVKNVLVTIIFTPS